MSAGREELLDLVAAHALGVLPAHELARVTAFLRDDAEARREFAALRLAADAVGLSAEAEIDAGRAARMKARVMDAVRTEQRLRPRPSSARAVAWATALAAAAALVFALVSVIQNLGLRSELAETARRATVLEARVVAERAAYERSERILADLAATDATRYAVPYGTVVRHGTRLYLALGALPVPPHGHVYQAWTLPRGSATMAPSVTFVPSPSGTTLVPLPENADRVAAVGINIEPDGGSKVPTTKSIFVQPLT